MSINIIKQTSTANTTSSPGRQIKYIVIHYTAGTSSKPGNARANASWFGNPSAQASADYIVDDAEIVQMNPDPRNRYCWAVGGGKYNTKGGRLYGVAKNSNCISIEICSNNSAGKITYPNDPKYYFTDASVNNAVLLTQYLMKEYNIDADHVIRHYDVNGKQCPGIIGWNADTGSEQKWVEFKQRVGGTYEEPKWYRVRISWENADSQKGAFIQFDKAKECADQNPGFTVYDSDGKAVYKSKELPSVEAAIAAQTKDKSFALLKTLPDYKGLPESKEDYLAKVAEIAIKLYPYTRFLPSVVISQAFLENGGGVASDAIELTKRSNLIGQKAELLNSTWQDQTVWDGTSFSKRTPEVYGGVPTTIVAKFRVFPNYAYSILDYEMFITHAKISATKYKYRDVIGMTDPKTMITAIGNRGYATGPTYPTSIMRVINQYDLTKYDRQAFALLQSGDNPSPAPVPPSPTPTPIPVPTPTPDPSTGKQTWYRAQVGVYQMTNTRDNRIAQIKKTTGYDCFYEKTNDLYYIYCGSFKEKEQAQNRVNELISKGINAFVKEVKV